jgi:hypothetical protein
MSNSTDETSSFSCHQFNNTYIILITVVVSLEQKLKELIAGPLNVTHKQQIKSFTNSINRSTE